MSELDVLDRKARARVYKCSLNVLLMKSALLSLRNQMAAINARAKEEDRELKETEKEELADIRRRVDAKRTELAAAENAFHAGNDDAVMHLRALSGGGRHRYLMINSEHQQRGEGSAPPWKVVALGYCREDGTLKFDLDKKEDAERLADYDGQALDAIAIEIFAISGLSQDPIETTEKKSEASPS